jgi:transcriptional regulator with XRE-family HTH domain
MNKIKLRLKELGKSQTWLAIESGMTLPYINNVIKNKVAFPRIDTGFKISHALGVSIESLWSFEEKKNGSNELPNSTSS